MDMRILSLEMGSIGVDLTQLTMGRADIESNGLAASAQSGPVLLPQMGSRGVDHSRNQEQARECNLLETSPERVDNEFLFLAFMT